MKKLITILCLLFSVSAFSQSNFWDDLYDAPAYNNGVKLPVLHFPHRTTLATTSNDSTTSFIYIYQDTLIYLYYNHKNYKIGSASGLAAFNFDSAFATKTTSNLTEGSRLYYTDARARAAISVVKVPLSYTPLTGVLDFDTANWHSANYYNVRFQPIFSGNGYVKQSGSTTGYQAVIPVSDGGTGLTSIPAGYIPYGNTSTGMKATNQFNFTGGNLGIGTSNPLYNIHVNGNGYIAQFLKVGAYTFTGVDGTTGQVMTRNSAGEIVLQTPAATTSVGNADSLNHQLPSYYLDYDNFTNKPNLSGYVTNVTASSPLTSSTGITPNISISQASPLTDGYLSSTDWNTFNNKQSALGFTPENTANKKTTLTNSATDYPSTSLLTSQLALKQNTITPGTTAQYLRGDFSLATFPTAISSFTNDAGYLTSTSLNGYLPLSGGTMTGAIVQPNAPVNAFDLTNKSYIDNLITGITWKNAVRAATTGNVTLSGLQTIDGVSSLADARYLVKNQTDNTQNGIYLMKSGAWVRVVDVDNSSELIGATVMVAGGTLNKNTQWTNSSDVNTIGSDAIVFVQIAGAGTYTNGSGLALTGNVFSIPALGVTNSMINDVAWNKVTGTPTTRSGYGITDAYPLTGGAYLSAVNGVGFLGFHPQTSPVATPVDGFYMYDSAGITFLRNDGFRRILSFQGISANSKYNFPTSVTSDTLVTRTSYQTLTNKSGNISQWTNDAGYITGATDATLTKTGTTLGLNLGNVNTWSAQQLYSNTSTGLAFYNTSDQTTNFERLSLGFSGNTAILGTDNGGTGSIRSLQLASGSTSMTFLNVGTGNGHIQVARASNVAGITLMNIRGAQTQTSGSQTIFSLTPTYNQTSSTAANTDLLINRTETSVGTGTQRFIDLQVNGSSKFYVDNTGAASAANLGIASRIVIGSTNPTSASALLQFSTTAFSTVNSFDANGFAIRQNAATYTSTAASGSPSVVAVNSIGIPTLAATNSQTITTGSTLYIAGPLTAGSNVTIAVPNSLHVAAGRTFLNGSMRYAYNAKSANYTITANDYYIPCTGTITITLIVTPAGTVYKIKNKGSGVITVSGVNIDGNGSYSLGSLNKYVEITSNGTDYDITGNN